MPKKKSSQILIVGIDYEMSADNQQLFFITFDLAEKYWIPIGISR